MSERQIDPTPILILFRMLFNDGQLKCLEENADNSIIFSNFYKLIYKTCTRIRIWIQIISKCLRISVCIRRKYPDTDTKISIRVQKSA
uniref:Uncharacterized protein n=1 Tax=Meloidogyne incognita TaxID=6306 RepID=A0A914KSW9_MELIC